MMYAFTQPHARAGCDTRIIFKLSKASFNPKFSFSLTSCLTKAKEPSLSYYLPTAGGRADVFMPFRRTLARSEMQTASSKLFADLGYRFHFLRR